MPESPHRAGRDALRAGAAQLQAVLDSASDEETARPLADELHALIDSVENVVALEQRQ